MGYHDCSTDDSSDGDDDDMEVEFERIQVSCPMSWIPDLLVATKESDCILSCALFKVPSPAGQVGATYTEGRNLVQASTVLAADGITTLQVATIEENDTDTLIELCVRDPFIMYDITTPSHHVFVPARRDQTKQPSVDICSVRQLTTLYEDVPAKDLQVGDMVVCSDCMPRKLSSIREIAKPEKVKVLKIAFKPDMPVSVFKPPLTVLTKGNKKKDLRRSRKGKQPQFSPATEHPRCEPMRSEPDISDDVDSARPDFALTVKNTFIDVQPPIEEDFICRRRSSSAPIHKP